MAKIDINIILVLQSAPAWRFYVCNP